MSKGSPVYRREKQRVILGLVTKRQRNILLIGLVVSIFFVNRFGGVNHKEVDVWKVVAIPKSETAINSPGSGEVVSTEQPYPNTQDDWGALPSPSTAPTSTPNPSSSEVSGEGNTPSTGTLQEHEVPPTDIYYHRGTVVVNWQQDPMEQYEYQVYLNGQLVGTTKYDFFQFNYNKNKKSGGIDQIYIIKAIVFLLFFIVAFVEYNGTTLEVYAYRVFKQYFEFKRVFKLPVIGLNVSLPVKKQTVFYLERRGGKIAKEAKAKVAKRMKPTPLLKKETEIDKVFTSYSEPVEFDTKLGAIEIQHPAVTVKLIRNKKGGIEVVLRDK